ncbi:MAG: preprotein translocase subunit SecG [Planctomycetota bacterium]
MVIFLMIVLGVVSVLLGLAILLQEPKQAGLSGAFGMGGESQMLGTSTTSGIARFTMYLSVAFFVLCIAVGLLAREGRDDSRLLADPIETSIGSVEDGVGDALGDSGIGLDDGIPTDTVPANTVPADPADTVPANTAPADTAPADTAPADTAPADTAPADTAPADTAPADAAPADAAPADAAPADAAPDENGGTGN